jgi:hypothetical protein
MIIIGHQRKRRRREGMKESVMNRKERCNSCNKRVRSRKRTWEKRRGVSV